MRTFVGITLRRGCHKRTSRVTRRISLLVIFLLCSLFLGTAKAEPPYNNIEQGPNIEKALDYFDFSEIDKLLNDSEIFERFSTKEIVKRLVESGYSITEIVAMLDLSTVTRDAFRRSIRLLIIFFVLIILTVVIRSLGKKSEYGEFAEKVVLILCMVISVPVIKECAQAATQVYKEIKSVSSIIVPVLSTVLTAMGGIGTAGLTQALLLLVNETLLSVIQNVLMPIVAALAVIYVISPLADRPWLDGLADTVNAAMKWVFGLLVTISSAIFSLRTMSMSAVDGVMLRTAEYAVDDLIPIVGGALSDITAVMAGGMLMVKNAVGIVAVVLLILKATAPMLVILIYMFLFKIAFSVCKMNGADKIAAMTNNVSKVLLLYLVCCVSVMMMIMVIIVSSVAAGNRIITYR